MNKHPVILFDAVCNLCNSSVQYVIKNDKDALFKFASLQSNSGQHLLQKHALPQEDFTSFVLIENDTAYIRSTAALRVARRLSGPVKLLYGFIIVPAFIRDAVYNFISKNRYRWFGKKDSCMIPSPGLKQRFLN
ncbi:MAG: thiol-disulfide oxidoreductase DCC family protein [Sphingobacteriales bacterium]|nr:MAG: thiol-disulfide oxidoreductase DCC family protein [Sphingobacteriales bacterium]